MLIGHCTFKESYEKQCSQMYFFSTALSGHLIFNSFFFFCSWSKPDSARKRKAEQRVDLTMHSDYTQHIYLKSENRLCIALKCFKIPPHRHSKYTVGVELAACHTGQQYSKNMMTIREAFGGNLKEMEGGLVTGNIRLVPSMKIGELERKIQADETIGTL